MRNGLSLLAGAFSIFVAVFIIFVNYPVFDVLDAFLIAITIGCASWNFGRAISH